MAPRAEITQADHDIAAIYQQLQGQMQQGVDAQRASFSNAKSSIGSVYDQMTSALTQQANATAGAMGNQFNMLGIGAAQDSATNDLRGQLNQALISGQRLKASEQSGLVHQSAAYGQAGREGIANVGRESARSRTETRSKLEEAMAALEAAKVEAQGQYDVQRLQGEVQLEQMRAQQRAAAARSGGGGGRSGSPLDMLRAQLLGLQILEKKQGLEEGPESQWSKRGQGGLNAFMGGPSDYWENQAGPKFRGALDNIIDYASAQANNPRSIASGMKDPYTIASGRVDNAPGYIDQDALRMALQIYYGKG